MARLIGFRRFLGATIVVVAALSGRASAADPLRLITDIYSSETLNNDRAPGPGVEVLKQVFAAMGQDVSFESFPPNRAWSMLLRGEADGMVSKLRTRDREQICFFPDEPMRLAKWVLFIRTADFGKLKFSSFDDLVGHDVAVKAPDLGLLEQPTASLELSQFLREHHNIVETVGAPDAFRMLAAGRVDYVVSALGLGRSNVVKLGLSGKIEPLLSRSVLEGGVYSCFSKARVSSVFVDAFSQALKQFKQTEAYQAINHKYFPELPPAQ